MNELEVICAYMNKCGFNAEIRHDRYRQGEVCPYVNYGDSRHPRDRVQFWMEAKSGIQMYVGIKMARWYYESNKSPYLNSDWGVKDKENQVRFPDLNAAKDFIKRVSKY